MNSRKNDEFSFRKEMETSACVINTIFVINSLDI